MLQLLVRSLFKSKHTICSATRMSSTGLKYLSQEEATSIDKELFSDYAFSVDQLMELAGLSAAQAIYQLYGESNSASSMNRRVLVIVGPGNNGGDGLVCSRHLKLFGFNPVVLYPKASKSELMERLVKQTRLMGISHLQELPSYSSPLADEYSLVVDAAFGFSFKPPMRQPFADILGVVAKAGVPIFSIDIPSGWDVEKGPPPATPGGVPCLHPHALISLTAPKMCANHFKGPHFLGGRFIPEAMANKYELNLPTYEGSSGILRLS